MTQIKEKFINDLIDVLNDENKYRICYDNEPLDVCFIVSAIEQQIGNNEYKEFLEDISQNKYQMQYEGQDINDLYSNGSVAICIINDNNKIRYLYRINFLFDDRPWGDCQCQPGDEDYNKKYECCGNGCGWRASAFDLTKTIYMGNSSWDGNQKDYWRYEEEFDTYQSRKNEEVERYIREEKIKSINNKIKELQEELKSLVN